MYTVTLEYTPQQWFIVWDVFAPDGTKVHRELCSNSYWPKLDGSKCAAAALRRHVGWQKMDDKQFNQIAAAIFKLEQIDAPLIINI